PAFFPVCARPAPAFAPPVRFFLLCHALSRAQSFPACSRLRFFLSFSPWSFSFIVFYTSRFSLCAKGACENPCQGGPHLVRPPCCTPVNPARRAAQGRAWP